LTESKLQVMLFNAKMMKINEDVQAQSEIERCWKMKLRKHQIIRLRLSMVKRVIVPTMRFD
jgi:hypothetical protein